MTKGYFEATVSSFSKQIQYLVPEQLTECTYTPLVSLAAGLKLTDALNSA